ncbi:hypothetical protein FMJ63_25255 [Klebsiella michiganensis]|nr:hypothetical protein [Klebsiella michiganensis]
MAYTRKIIVKTTKRYFVFLASVQTTVSIRDIGYPLYFYAFCREPYRIAPCYQACACNITIPKRKGIQKTSIMTEKNLLRDCIQIPVNYFFSRASHLKLLSSSRITPCVISRLCYPDRHFMG